MAIWLHNLNESPTQMINISPHQLQRHRHRVFIFNCISNYSLFKNLFNSTVRSFFLACFFVVAEHKNTVTDAKTILLPFSVRNYEHLQFWLVAILLFEDFDLEIQNTTWQKTNKNRLSFIKFFGKRSLFTFPPKSPIQSHFLSIVLAYYSLHRLSLEIVILF